MKNITAIVLILTISLLFVSLNMCNNLAESKKTQVNEWYKIFGSTGKQEVLSLALTSDQGYILAGWDSQDDTALIIKTDRHGNQEWDMKYGGGGNKAEAYDVVESSDGGYIFTGYIKEGLFILKTDNTGTILWDKVHSTGDEKEWGKSIVEVDDGLAIMGKSGDNIWLIKTDDIGNLIWQRTYGGISGDAGYSLIRTADSGYIISGITYSYGRGGDIWVIKTDEHGMEQWNVTYGGNEQDRGYDIIETRDGFYAIVGGITPTGKGWNDVFIMKIDDQGNEIWTKIYGGSDMDVAHKILQMTDGSFIITASTQSHGLSVAGGSEAWLLKVDENGNQIWNKTLGGRGSDSLVDIIEAYDGSFILCGSTESYGSEGIDAWLVRCEDYAPPALSLLDPEENNIYAGDWKLIPSQNTVILGKKTVEVSVIDPDERMQRVEFYVESSFGTLYEHQMDSAPYRWVFDEWIAGYCYLGVSGYYSSNGAHVATGLFPWMFNL